MIGLKSRRIGYAVAAGLLAVPSVVSGQVVPTKVMVRVIAHDAKIIGSNVGGARVTITDVTTGEILAEGVQEGTTGDTRTIVVEPRARGTTIYDTEGAAGFLATLHIAEPTVVDISVEGPLGTPHAMQTAAQTLLVVPGQDVLGDGVIIELWGFTVVLEAPKPNQPVDVGQRFEIRANVTMLCGCPIEPGGLWDADRIRVVARLRRDNELLAEVPMAFTGTTSTFAGRASVDTPGDVYLQIVAMDPTRGNFGSVESIVRVAGTQ